MNPYRQNPDMITPRIRAEYRALGVAFIEPPPGLGCDFIIRGKPITFVEVKDPSKADRFTNAEIRLQAFASLIGVPYIIITTLDEALSAAGFTVE